MPDMRDVLPAVLQALQGLGPYVPAATIAAVVLAAIFLAYYMFADAGERRNRRWYHDYRYKQLERRVSRAETQISRAAYDLDRKMRETYTAHTGQPLPPANPYRYLP